jgi:hypothetical protein
VPPMVCHPYDHVFGVGCHPECRFGPRGHLYGRPIERRMLRRRFMY